MGGVEVKQKERLLVCSIYRPPDCGNTSSEVFAGMMESAATEGKEVLLMGDLNINLMSSTPNSRFLESHCKELSLTQMITGPTRVTQSSATLIDHIYV